MMREKTKRFLVTFRTTQEAMAAECFLKEHALPGRLIPVPRQITAGCGLAWSAPPESRELLLEQMRAGKVCWQDCCELDI